MGNKKPKTKSKVSRTKAVKRKTVIVPGSEREQQVAGPAPVCRDWLHTMPQPLDKDTQRKVEDLITKHGINSQQLSDHIQAAGVEPKQAVAVERTLRLAKLTLQHLPVMVQLQTVTAQDPDASLKSLAAVKPAEWLDLAKTHGTPAQGDMSPETYAKKLEQAVEELHPTAVLAARLKDNDLVINKPGFEKVAGFLNNHPEFNILQSRVPVFLSKPGLNSEEKNQLAQPLLQLQRMKKLSATWEETGHLLNAGAESALHIVRDGKKQLQIKLAGKVAPERVEDIYNRAKNVHDASLGLMANVMPRFSPVRPAAMAASTPDQALLENYPELQTLFGPQDYDACDPSQSVLSPAAYYADLLQFLHYAQNSIWILMFRRPDLLDLELSSTNTNTELPYIDLVLEVLENAVALPLAIDLPAGTDVNNLFNSSPLPAIITEVLNKTTLQPVGNNLIVKKDADSWTICDQQRRWTLRNYAADPLTVSAPNLPVMPLADTADLIATWVESLNLGSISQDMQNQLQTLLQQHLYHDVSVFSEFILKNCQIKTVLLRKLWRMVCQFGGLCIEKQEVYPMPIEGGQPLFYFKLQAPDGTYFSQSENIDGPTIADMESELDQGKLPNSLSSLLPVGDPFTIQKDQTAGSWSVWFFINLDIGYLPQGLVVESLTYQTLGDSGDLIACPRNKNSLVYEEFLRDAKFPWSLPFDLPLTSIRAYLDQLGVTRRQLLELIRPYSESQYNYNARDYELLGLSQEDVSLVSVDHDAPFIWQCWGVMQDANGNINLLDAKTGEQVSGPALEVLSRISMLMQQARISYDDLLAVLGTRFAGGNCLAIDPSADINCPSNLTLEQPTTGQLDRIYRFIYLWRKLNWDITDLDIVITEFFSCVAPWNRSFYAIFGPLATFKRLQRMLALPIRELLSWWKTGFIYRPNSPQGQPSAKSVYEQVYLNPQILNPPDPALVIGPNEELPQEASLTSKTPILCAALGIQKEDFDFIMANSSLSDALRLYNLGMLYSTVRLARSLELSFADFLKMQSFMAAGRPFDSPDYLLDFCEMARFIKETGFSMEELTYLLLDEPGVGLAIVLGDNAVKQILDNIRAGMQAELGSMERQIQDQLAKNPATANLAGLAVLDETRLAAVLTDANVRSQLADRVIRQAAGFFNVEFAVAQRLLMAVPSAGGNSILKNPYIVNQAAMEVFFDPRFIGQAAQNTPAVDSVVRKLYQATILLNRLEIKPDDLAWITDPPQGSLGVELNYMNADKNIPALFKALRQLIFRFRIHDYDNFELLGLSREEVNIIGINAPTSAFSDPWGVVPDANGTINLFDAEAGKLVSGPALEVLSKISLLMQQARICYDDLMAVLGTRFVGGGGLAIQQIDPSNDLSNPCNLKLVDLTPYHLDRIHRFIRLWRKLEWSITELDMAIGVLSPSQQFGSMPLYSLMFRDLATFKRLQEMLDLPMCVLISWWDGANGLAYRPYAVKGRPAEKSLYEQVYLNPLIQNPPDSDLMGIQTGVSSAVVSLTAKASIICAALGIQKSELNFLIANCSLTDSLSLSNLLALYRTVRLARSLSVSFPDFFRMHSFIPMGRPFDGLNDLLDFCEIARFIKNSGFNVEEVAYLLFDEPVAGLAIILNSEAATKILTSIRAGIQAKLGSMEQQIRDQLAKDPATADLVSLDPLNETRLATSLLSADVRNQLADVVVSQAAGFFNLSAPMVQRLLVTTLNTGTAILKNPGNAAQAAVEVFFDPQFIGQTAQHSPVTDSLIHKLHKVSVLLNRLKVKPAELAWIADPQQGLSGLDFNTLPATNAANGNAPALFKAWQQLVLTFQIRSQFSGMSALLDQYVAALPGLAAEALAQGLALPLETVQAAVTQLQISDFRDPFKLKVLLDLLLVLKKMGATVTQAVAITRGSPSLEDAQIARSLLRAKYDDDSWNGAIKSISDCLRVQQRDALVDYLIDTLSKGGLPIRSANELYEYFLIDPEMTPTMLTSRLVQATAAVQLYIQRCWMNLEIGSIEEDKRGYWEWMKNYRLWQANREVFLYPENWLYSELRDDKTRAFADLESGFTQAEPTYALAKEKMQGYMDEILELSKIKVLGMYEDMHYCEYNNAYIIGRTPNQPYSYYWRKNETLSMAWTGWEKIDLDISDDHVMPFVMEGNLHLAWPTITKKIPGNQNGAFQNPYWEIKLNWARYLAKGWGKKKTSKESDIIRVECSSEDADAARDISFRLLSDAKGAMYFFVYAWPQLTTWYPSPPFFRPEGILKNAGSTRIEICIQLVEKILNVCDQAGNEVTRYFYAQGYPMTQCKLVVVDKNQQFTAIPLAAKESDGFGNVVWTQDIAHPKDVSSITLAIDGLTIDYQEPLVTWRQNFSVEPGDVIQLNKVIENRLEHNVMQNPVMSAYGQFMLTPVADIQSKPKCIDDAPAFDTVQVPFSNPVNNGYLEKEIVPVANGNDLVVIFDGITTTKKQFVKTQFFLLQAAKSYNYMQFTSGLEHLYYEDLYQKYYLFACNYPGSSGAFWGSVQDEMSALAELCTESYDDFNKLYAQASQESLALPVSYADNFWSIDFKPKQFDLRVPAAIYKWELFFHVPLLMAEFLTKQQRFEDAQKWLHFIFNPTQPVNNNLETFNYWQFLPFQQPLGETLRSQFNMLALAQAGIPLIEHQVGISQSSGQSRPFGFLYQLGEWQNNPFSPFVVARSRTIAFQWRTLFSYLDNLIAWGDQLFRGFTRESINEAILLYILAAKLLGPRPNPIPSRQGQPASSFRDLQGKWDAFSNAWVTITDILPADGGDANASTTAPGPTQVLSSLGMLYFGIPANDKLLGYWDTVEDRLFKIRHCQDIDGQGRSLPLFAPPIDPELLVRATAAGLDIATLLSDLDAPLLPCRFNVLLQKANEICAEVKSLGASLLAALEKKDAESLARLRSSQEIELLNLVTYIKQKQVDEANAVLSTLDQNLALVKVRFTQYQKLLGNPSLAVDASGVPVLSTSSMLKLAANTPGEEKGLGLIQYEVDQLTSLNDACAYNTTAGMVNTYSSTLHALPNSITGLGEYIDTGGSHFGHAANALAAFLNTLAVVSSHEANKKGMFASYQRRQDEWVFQSELAVEEMKQIQQQILAAQIRLEIAERELENHQKQIEQVRNLDTFMHEKFTSQELYSWMEGQLAHVYFTCYQLAYDTAKSAERAFQNELGTENIKFIQFGYWDSLKKGLLAGENLSLDLKRMEMAYLEQNRRQLELTKHISLALLDPVSLLTLKATGECLAELPETLFDQDYPGHYMRRIKSVSLTIPCVAGPYTNINCTLRLEKNSVRIKPTLLNNSYAGISGADPRFRNYPVCMQAIATSHGQNDSGMFEVNFHDERYLPFEGAGVISRWRLQLSQDCNTFDVNTISDVVMHIKYTAMEETRQILGPAAKQAAMPQSGACLLSARHEFPGDWNRFLNPDGNSAGQILAISFRSGHFPFILRGRMISIVQVDIFVQPIEGGDLSQIKGEMINLTPQPAGDQLQNPMPTELADVSAYGKLLHGQIGDGANALAEFILENNQPPLAWKLEVPGTLDSDGKTYSYPMLSANVRDVMIVFKYTIQ